jgi:chitinase
MANAIMNNLMTFEYEQIILTRDQDTILESEFINYFRLSVLVRIIMTVVWRLPGGNGLGGIDPAYQDHNPATAQEEPDEYVVFHFHTEHIARVQGADRPGIFAISAFHGQYYNTGNYQRVDGNDNQGRNQRAHVLRCNTGDESNEHTLFLYPGYSTADNLADRARLLTQFLDYLAGQGLLTTATFTGPGQGRLTLSVPDACGRQYFGWGERRRTSQFGANGAVPPRGSAPPGTGGGANPPATDNQQDNDSI